MSTCLQHREQRQRTHTKSESSMMDAIRSAHSSTGMQVGCFLYSLSNVKAAFFLTKAFDVLQKSLCMSYHSTNELLERD